MMDNGDKMLVAAGVTAAVMVGAYMLWGPAGVPRARTRRGQIAGLQNNGRTCFLNTLLQALAACPAFIKWLRKFATVDNSLITTLHTVIEVVNGTHETARGNPVCPIGVLETLKASGWVIPADQQDAHELLHVVLACIENEKTAMARKPGCLSDALGLGEVGPRALSALASPATPPATPHSGRVGSAPPTPSSTCGRPASAVPTHEPDLIDPEPSVEQSRLTRGVSRSLCLLSTVGRRLVPAASFCPAPPAPFCGMLASRLQCTVCSAKSPIRYDKFESVSLSMTDAGRGITGAYSLAGLLRAFTAPELVKGVRCSKCCPETNGTSSGEPSTTMHIRTVSFGKLPTCLCLHISRLEWSHGTLNKRSEHVSFPETLSLPPYSTVTEPQLELKALLNMRMTKGLHSSLAALNAGPPTPDRQRALYKLVAVVVHMGGPRSGHFVTYRRGNGFEAKRWWYTSDTFVHEVSLQEVLRCAAYMIFYERTKDGTVYVQ